MPPITQLLSRTDRFKPLNRHRPNTKRLHSSSANTFELFRRGRETKGIPTLDKLTQEDFATQEQRDKFIEEVKCYASFLLEHKHDGTDHYKCGTMTTKLSGLINGLKKSLPQVKMLQVGDPKKKIPPHPEAMWYIDLQHDLKTVARVNAIKRGESISGSSSSIR